MSGADILVISMNLIGAVAMYAFVRHRDRGVLKAVRLAEIWSRPLNSYPLQSPLQN